MFEKLGRDDLGNENARDKYEMDYEEVPSFEKAKIWIQTNKMSAIGIAMAGLFMVVGVGFFINLTRANGGSGVGPEEIVPVVENVSATTGVANEKNQRAHIMGAVKNPDVYTFQAGDRVEDLLMMAGGSSAGANLNTLNLAQKLFDEQKICVPLLTKNADEDDGCLNQQQQQYSVAPANAPININLADAKKLDELPGIGLSFANAIVAYRTQNGPFTSVDELAEISGITTTTIDKFRDRIRV